MVDGNSDSSASEDDEDGVFLGKHRSDEVSLLDKLSLLSPSATTSLSRKHSSRSEPSSLKKRDSREFHRRRTILLPLSANTVDGEGSEKKVWGGGFYEKVVPEIEADNAPASTSSQRTVYFSARTDLSNDQNGDRCDAEDAPSSSSRGTVYFSAPTSSPLRMSIKTLDTPPKLEDCNIDCTQSHQEDSSSSSDLDSDSDKENVGPPLVPSFGDYRTGDIPDAEGASFIVGLDDVDRGSTEIEIDDEEAEYGDYMTSDEDGGGSHLLLLFLWYH